MVALRRPVQRQKIGSHRPTKEARGLATYPDPDAPYDSSVDPAWLLRLPGDIRWEPIDELETFYLTGRLVGSCPRCGHGINHDIQKDTIAAGGAAEESAQPSHAERTGKPVQFVCNCLSSHEKDKTGCGVGFELPWEMLIELPGHP
jgi:hypothetical protein